MAEYQAPMAEREKRENPETTSSSSNLHDACTISTGTNRNDSNRFPRKSEGAFLVERVRESKQKLRGSG